jgi:hypothetical protein
MKACRVVLISRGLRIWIPPEVYLVGDLAEREASRWREALRLPRQPGTFSQNARALHLVESMFPEQWRACPVWVGVTWSSRSFPRLKIELMAADEDEATEWPSRPNSEEGQARTTRSCRVRTSRRADERRYLPDQARHGLLRTLEALGPVLPSSGP